jgi:hypothetical protein
MMTRPDLNGHAHPGAVATTSAYPKRLEDLVAEAERLAREVGAIPSQNKLKAALHVRSERARTVLQTLQDSGFDPTKPDTEPGTGSAETAREPVPDVDPNAVSTPASPTIPGQVSVPTEPVPATTSVSPQTWWERVRQTWHLQDHAGSVDSAGNSREEPVSASRPGVRRVSGWPMVLLAAPAFVAIWSGWVGLGALTGFGMVHPLPGIADEFTINSAITLPIGVEAYAAYALRVWLSTGIGARARRFAKWSAIGSLLLGMAGQVAYHLMIADHVTTAPSGITTAVACLPVVVLGFGAALAHLQHRDLTEVRP